MTIGPYSECPSADGQCYIFHGGGWGHGVGLCQEGAAGMARRGLTSAQIIRHYFPGTKIVP
ncbi:MAG: hypothetical protein V2A78_07365 [bacterium]